MENAIILNIILLTIVGVGVLLYFVWLGSSVMKLKVNQKLNTSYCDELNDKIDNEFDNQSKELDKLDSRFDRRINDEVVDIHKSIKSLEEHKKDK